MVLQHLLGFSKKLKPKTHVVIHDKHPSTLMYLSDRNQIAITPKLLELKDDETWRRGFDRLHEECARIARGLSRDDTLTMDLQ